LNKNVETTFVALESTFLKGFYQGKIFHAAQIQVKGQEVDLKMMHDELRAVDKNLHDYEAELIHDDIGPRRRKKAARGIQNPDRAAPLFIRRNRPAGGPSGNFETESQGSYDAKPLLVSWASYKKYRRRDAEKTANNEVPTFFFIAGVFIEIFFYCKVCHK